MHALLLVVSLATLPIYPTDYWKPISSANPTWGIISLLAAKIGVPYFLLSTTGPLLQAWYARSSRARCPTVYMRSPTPARCSRCSATRFLFEPVFTTHQQAFMWSVAYGGFIVICGLTALRSRKDANLLVASEAALEEAPRPPVSHYWMWLALPACASTLLLAITNQLSQNVAAIPFLWVLPLSIYLLTFILCFEGDWYWRNPYLQLLAVALGSMAYLLGPTMMAKPEDHSLHSPVFHRAFFSAACPATANWPG